MKNFKKIGLTALAASLVSATSFAGTMDVTGAASISYAGGSEVTGNGWSMNDNISFSGGGEMDNGWNITATFLLDNGDGTGAQIFDNRSIAIDMDTMGTLTFWGQSADSVLSAHDDKMPAAYEESWYGATGPGTGATTSNMFYYSNAAIVDGVTMVASYTPSGGAELASTTEVGLVYTGIEGLTLGFATGDDAGAGSTAKIANNNMWVTYAIGSATLGYQSNESDSTAASSDTEFTAMAISYAVSGDLSVSYGVSELEKQGSAAQESAAFGASYTMGSMTLAGAAHSHDNEAHVTTDDTSNYEMTLTFAF
jgi:outer membrane protein OmpU